jgi:hypothetical protein
VDEVVEVIVDPFTHEKLPLRLPLTYGLAPEAARSRLGLPPHVDTTDPVVARAVGLLQALTEELPGRPVALLGGVGYRFRAPSSNSLSSGLRRPLHDIDLACHDSDVRRLLAALLRLGPTHGSALTVVETHSDRMFNALMGGRRLRLHSVDQVVNGRCELGTIDLLADEFRFCHTLDLTDEISQAPEDLHTLSPSTLLLTKLQFIQSIPAEHRSQVPGRVLGPFGKKELIIGPEEKDVRDLLALLTDRPVGEARAEISLRRFLEPLADDWGFWTTVRLNLDHLVESPVFAGLPSATQPTVRERIGQLRAATDRLEPKRPFRFLRHEWWEPVESLGTPAPPGPSAT